MLQVGKSVVLDNLLRWNMCETIFNIPYDRALNT